MKKKKKKTNLDLDLLSTLQIQPSVDMANVKKSQIFYYIIVK